MLLVFHLEILKESVAYQGGAMRHKITTKTHQNVFANLLQFRFYFLSVLSCHLFFFLRVVCFLLYTWNNPPRRTPGSDHVLVSHREQVSLFLLKFWINLCCLLHSIGHIVVSFRLFGIFCLQNQVFFRFSHGRSVCGRYENGKVVQMRRVLNDPRWPNETVQGRSWRARAWARPLLGVQTVTSPLHYTC